jgi:hypothetical protein
MLTKSIIHQENQNTKNTTSSNSSRSSKSSTIKYIPVCSICGAQRGLVHDLGADLFYCAFHVGEVTA